MKPVPSQPARLYWWQGRSNLGDLLSPIILEKYTGVTPEWSDPLLANVVCVGSVIDNLPPTGWPGRVPPL